jgi:hypothetical protein
LSDGRNPRVIDGTRFTFTAPEGWGSFGASYPHYISKSATGPQGAEAVVFWTGYPAVDHAQRCERILSGFDRLPAVQFIEAAAAARGIDVVSEPEGATVGGRPAAHVVLRVRKDYGCDPGYFFLWAWVDGGELWPETTRSDMIELWALDVDQRTFVIEAISHPDAGAVLIAETHQIVGSIQFE